MPGQRDRFAWLVPLWLAVWISACGALRSASLGSAPWIEPVAVRLAGDGEFVDVRFRYHGREPFNPDRPGIFLIDEASGEKLFLLQLQRIGTLGRKGDPDETPVHSVLFKNLGRLLKPGARVTLVIGETRTEHLLLEK